VENNENPSFVGVDYAESAPGKEGAGERVLLTKVQKAAQKSQKRRGESLIWRKFPTRGVGNSRGPYGGSGWEGERGITMLTRIEIPSRYRQSIWEGLAFQKGVRVTRLS